MKTILSLSLICFAQCAFAQKSFFGADAGINVANQRMMTSLISPGFQSANHIAFGYNAIKPSFGIFYQKWFSDLLALRLNAQYMGLGYDSKGSSGTAVTINYLTLPLTLHYATNKHLSFSAGPYLSFTLGGTKINNEDITKTYHKNDFGFSFGAEHDLYKNISFGINYFVGLKNIWLNDTQTVPGVYTTTNKYTNRALQFTLIYKFKKPN